jgi:MSHA pilin protein MshC
LTHPTLRPHLRHRRAGAGFTLVELIVTMIIVGVLAAAVLPRLSNTANAATTFADRMVATLVLAQKTAVTHRRLVCVDTAARALTLFIATINPATDCPKVKLVGQDDADTTTNDTAVAASSANGLVGTRLYFLPNGDIRMAVAGAYASGTILVKVAGQTNAVRGIAIDGRTGYVDYAN